MDYVRFPGCDVCRSVDSPESWIIFRSEFWGVDLAPDQRYLGRVYITTLDHVPDVPSLGKARWLDYYEVLCQYEALVKRVFGATHLTYATLMNHGYRSNPPHPHVHTHVRPRYRSPVDFAGVKFKDKRFASHHLRRPRPASNELLRDIAVELRAGQ